MYDGLLQGGATELALQTISESRHMSLKAPKNLQINSTTVGGCLQDGFQRSVLRTRCMTAESSISVGHTSFAFTARYRR